MCNWKSLFGTNKIANLAIYKNTIKDEKKNENLNLDPSFGIHNCMSVPGPSPNCFCLCCLAKAHSICFCSRISFIIHVQKRGGKGVKCYKITEKTGYVVGVKAVTDEHEIMMITAEGIIIQIRMKDVNTYGRITSGVKLINLNNDVILAKIAKVREKVNEDGEIEAIDYETTEEETTEEQ